MLNVEGKVFIAVLAKRISGYFVDNRYIKSSIQKAGITRFSGYVEHTRQLIKEAKEGKKNFAAVWLDLTNAFGSVAHEGPITYTRLSVLLLLL